MVTNRQVQPIGLKRVVFAAEHGADVGGMLSRCVEIGVVANAAWQVHCAGRAKQQRLLPHGSVVAQRRFLATQQPANRGTRGVPACRSQAHEGVERGLTKACCPRAELLEHASLVQHGEVEDVVACFGGVLNANVRTGVSTKRTETETETETCMQGDARSTLNRMRQREQRILYVNTAIDLEHRRTIIIKVCRCPADRKEVLSRERKRRTDGNTAAGRGAGGRREDTVGQILNRKVAGGGIVLDPGRVRRSRCGVR